MGFAKFFEWFYKLRWVTIGVWLVVLGVCGYFALGFLELTNVNFIPPDGSPAALARRVYEEQFPDTCAQSRFVVLMQMAAGAPPSSVCTDVLANNWTRDTTERVVKAARSFAECPDLFVNASGRYTYEGQYDPGDFLALGFLQKMFVSENERSSILMLTTREHSTQRVFRWVRYMREQLARMDTCNGTYTLDLIGFDTLINDMSEGASADLKVMDGIALPIALLVFVMILRSLTVAVVPVLAVGASIVLCFGVMVPIAHVIDIPSYCPAIMMSIVIAMSIDYCLFLLTRFHEELARGRTPYAAAEYMLHYSGTTILTSGTVLTVCLGSLLAFPLRIIVAVGIGAAVSLMSTMLVALTLVPAVICAGLRFFAIRGLLPCVPRCRASVAPVTKEEAFAKEKRSYWFRFANFVTTVPRALVDVVVVCALLAPFCCGMLKMQLVENEDHVLPRNSETHDAIARFVQEWPVGELFTFDVVATAKQPNTSIFTPDFYDTLHRLALDLDNETEDFGLDGILSPADLGSQLTITQQYAQELLDKGEFVYTLVFGMLVNEDRTAARMTLASRTDPNLNASRAPAMLRPVLDRYTAATNYSFYLTNRIVDMHDSVDFTLRDYPLAVLIMAGVISAMVILAFQAPLLPLRMILTIALTVAWSYGVLSAIFSTTWFYWLSHNIADAPGICWIVPVLSLPMLVGLALDYDIFLFTRIREYRRRGWSPRAAVVKGVSKTGAVITYAGIIMAVAFSGLTFSGLMLMNQFGVLLALCVLLDTFVVRTTLNPALVYLFGPLNYWPRSHPVKYTDPTVYHEEAELEEDELPTTTTAVAAAGGGEQEEAEAQPLLRKHRTNETIQQ